MARRTASIDGKIKGAKNNVDKAKGKYDAAVDEFEKLLTKKQELQNAELMSAAAASSKSYAEIMAFLNDTGEALSR